MPQSFIQIVSQSSETFGSCVVGRGGVDGGVVDCGVQGGKGLVWNQFTPVFVGTRLPV